jgi:hypothetical protein
MKVFGVEIKVVEGKCRKFNFFLGVVLHVFISFSPIYLLSEEEGCVDPSDFLLFKGGAGGVNVEMQSRI